MSQTPAKQILKLLDGFVRVVNFAAAGIDDVATTALTTALSTASASGGAMPLQIASSSVVGVVTNAANNRVAIFSNASKLPLVDNNNVEVYGRITEAAGVYTLTYFTLVAGVETSTTVSSTNIDFEFTYRFDFERLPATFATGVTGRNVVDDPSGGAIDVEEARNPTALNTIAALSFAPSPTNSLVLIVNHLEYTPLDGSFSVSGTAVTWIPGVAGFNLETTDKVVARYRR